MESRISSVKINPPKPRRLISRPRLTQEVNTPQDYRLLLISAGSGYGKTSLLSDFAAHTEHAVCWYTLDETDRDPAQFCRYLLEAVRVVYPSFGNEFAKLLSEIEAGRSIEQENNLNRLGQIFASDLERLVKPGQLFPETIIVLDDYQFAESPLVGAFMRSLVLSTSDPFHFIISTRTIPDRLPLTVLIAQRMLKGIGAVELAFTREEVSELLSTFYDIANPEQVERFYTYSEGWITAVVLALANRDISLSRLHNRQGPFCQGYLDSRALFEYLGDEVLAGQPPDLQDFMLRTSVLPLLSPRLCQELTGNPDSEHLLIQIERRNLFIEHQGQNQTGNLSPNRESTAAHEEYYRYHWLFRQFLQSRLVKQPELWRASQNKAAELAIAAGNYQEAVQNYLNIDETERAAEIVARVSEQLYEAGRVSTLNEMLAQLPRTAIENNPVLAFTFGKISSEKGNTEEALDLMSKAEKAYLANGSIELATKSLANRAMLLARSGRLQEAVPLAERSLALLGSVETANPSRENQLARAMTILYTGVVDSENNKIERAEAHFKESIELFRKLGLRYYLAGGEVFLAVLYGDMGKPIKSNIYYERSLKYFTGVGNQSQELICRYGLARNLLVKGTFPEALEYFEQALELANVLGFSYYKSNILHRLGNLHCYTSRYARASTYYEQALELAREMGLRLLELEVLASMALNSLLNGQRLEAREMLLQGYELNQDYRLDNYNAILDDVMGLVEYETRSYKRAMVCFEKAHATFREAQWIDWLCRIKLHQALVYFSLGEFKKALNGLEESIDLVSGLGYEPFLPCDIVWATRLFEYAAHKKISEPLQEFLDRKGYLRASFVEESPVDDGESEVEEDLTPQVVLLPDKRLVEPKPGAPKLHLLRALDQGPESRVGLLAASGQYALEVRSLDGGRVWSSDKEIEHWRMGKARELFFYLLEHGKCTRDELVEALWPDADFASTPNLFHFTMSSLRKVIKPADVKLASQRYSLVGNIWHDVTEFERKVKEAISSSQPNISELSAALDLYKRDYLDQIYSDWATYRRQDLLQTYLEGLSILAGYFEGQRLFGQAAAVWRRYLLKNEYSEEAHRSLINCYLNSGNKKEARQQYAECVRMLEELDSSPSPQTQALLRKLA